MGQYYDYLLAIIPLSLLGTTSLLTLFGLELNTAVAIGGIATMAPIGHGMFVNAPRTDPPAQSTNTHSNHRTGISAD